MGKGLRFGTQRRRVPCKSPPPCRTCRSKLIRDAPGRAQYRGLAAFLVRLAVSKRETDWSHAKDRRVPGGSPTTVVKKSE